MNFLRRLFNYIAPPHQEAALATAPAPMNSYPLPNDPEDHLRYGQASDVGRSRKNNQDACMAFAVAHDGALRQPDFGLFVVADGMGGHLDGEKASSLTTRILAEYITTHAYLPLLAAEPDVPSPDLLDVLDAGILAANQAVTQQMPSGGTTLTAVLVYGDQAYISQVGDSRAYLIDGTKIEVLTRDHSLVQRLVELEQLTPEQAMEHPHRNILYRAIGQAEHLELDSKIVPLPPGARLLLCSDGLWTVVSEARMVEIITQAPDVQSACDELIEAANLRGGPDNITAVLVKLPSRPNPMDRL